MTKEEYVKELEKQFEEGETLIPDPPTAAAEQATDENAATATQTATEAQNGPAPAIDTGEGEKPADGSAEGETKAGEETGDADEKDAPKFSHRKFKKMEYENRTLRARLEALEAEVRGNGGKASDEAKETPKPRKADFATDEEYADALIAYRLKEIAKGAKAEEDKRAAEVADAQKFLADFNAKVDKYVPADKREWLNAEAQDGMEMLTELTGGKKNPTIRAIISSAKAPIVLAECLRNPSLAEALAKMGDVERQMTIWKIGETSRIFADTKTEQTATASAPVPIVGKVGVGATSAPKPFEQMTDDELYAEYLKSGGRV